MSRLFGSVFQMAYVVPELEPFIAHMADTLGIGPFFLFQTPLPFEWMSRHDVRTNRWDILAHAAIAYSGETMIEVIVPGSDPSPYRDFLDAGRSGLHHVGTWADDYDAQMAAARAAGIRVSIEGVLPMSRFAYLETDALWPGTMVEIIEPRPPMLEMFDTIKAAGRNWDGRDPLRTLS
ncbi:MAG: VOC family protein [Rhizobiales bacterium]|nr:VOC family protein [Rhizobacter sp.]